jgi:hypothetical protein
MKKIVLLFVFVIFYISSANAQVGIINNDTTICQGKKIALSLSGIKITYETTQIDQFVIGFRDGPFYRPIPTVIGQDYFFSVTGTIGFFSFQCEYDAFFKHVVSPPEPMSTFDMGIPNLRPNPDVYNSSHYYRIDFEATQTTTVFSAGDSYYKDNCGALNFTVYKRKTITDKRILWSTGDTTVTIKVTPLQTTTYYVTVTDGLDVYRDSVRVTVNPTYNEKRIVLINKGQKYIFGRDTLTAFGTYTHTFTTVLGCDSTVTIKLKEIPKIISEKTSICQGEKNELSLSGIKITYETTQIDQFRIPYRDGPFSRSIPTVVGQKYCFTVTGTMGFFSFQCEYDAFFVHVVSPPVPALGTFDMGIPNLRPNPDVYNGSHYYNIDFKAKQTNTVFTAGDSYYKDNCGALNFTVYKKKTITEERILWSTGDTTETITVSPTQTKTYYVDITDGDLTVRDSVKVIVNPSYNLEQEIYTDKKTYVFGRDTLISPGTYTYSYSSVFGCDSIVKLNLKYEPLIRNEDTTICQGDEVILDLMGINITYETTMIDQFGMTFTDSYDHPIPTVIGQDYFFTVTGQMNFFSSMFCNDYDAFFRIVSPPPTPCTTFSLNEPNFRPNPDVYNPSNYYRVDFKATTTPTVFSSSDSYYIDNCGQLDFTVYKRKSISDKRILWSTGDTTAFLKVKPLQTTTYYVTVDDGVHIVNDRVKIFVNPSYDEDKTVFINEGQNYIFGQDTLTAFGTYKHTFNTVLGCDSTVTLKLKEKPTVCFSDTLICNGENVLLKLKGIDYTYKSYQIDQFGMTFTGLYSHSVPTIIGQDYFFTVTGQMNFFSRMMCNDYDAFFRIVSSPPSPYTTFSLNEPNFRPNPDVYNPGNYYLINFTATTTPSVFISSDSYYKDNCGRLDFIVYRRDASTSQQFLWSTGDTTASIKVSPRQTTTYYVTIKDGKYSIQDSVRVIVNLPNNLEIKNYDGVTECFNASYTITISGKGTKVVFESGSSVTLIAGQNIRFLPEFQALSGSNMNASITTDSSFCNVALGTSIVTQPLEKSGKKETTYEVQSILPGKKTVKVYPNPNNGYFTLELTNFESGATFCIFNLLGERIYQTTKINPTSSKIDLSGIKRGIYFVKVVDKQEQFAIKMVVN